MATNSEEWCDGIRMAIVARRDRMGWGLSRASEGGRRGRECRGVGFSARFVTGLGQPSRNSLVFVESAQWVIDALIDGFVRWV